MLRRFQNQLPLISASLSSIGPYPGCSDFLLAPTLFFLFRRLTVNKNHRDLFFCALICQCRNFGFFHGLYNQSTDTPLHEFFNLFLLFFQVFFSIKCKNIICLNPIILYKTIFQFFRDQFHKVIVIAVNADANLFCRNGFFRSLFCCLFFRCRLHCLCGLHFSGIENSCRKRNSSHHHNGSCSFFLFIHRFTDRPDPLH